MADNDNVVPFPPPEHSERSLEAYEAERRRDMRRKLLEVAKRVREGGIDQLMILGARPESGMEVYISSDDPFEMWIGRLTNFQINACKKDDE